MWLLIVLGVRSDHSLRLARQHRQGAAMSYVDLQAQPGLLLQGQEAADACAVGVGRGSGFSLEVQRSGADDARRFNAHFV
jgi:hypothetical protein